MIRTRSPVGTPNCGLPRAGADRGFTASRDLRPHGDPCTTISQLSQCKAHRLRRLSKLSKHASPCSHTSHAVWYDSAQPRKPTLKPFARKQPNTAAPRALLHRDLIIALAALHRLPATTPVPGNRRLAKAIAGLPERARPPLYAARALHDTIACRKTFTCGLYFVRRRC